MDGLTRDARRLVAPLKLTENDLALLFALQSERLPANPWFALCLGRGWLTGDVVEPGGYPWQGAILLGIDPDEADDGE